MIEKLGEPKYISYQEMYGEVKMLRTASKRFFR